MIAEVALTPEELAEFTPFNAAAFNWMRMKTRGEGKISPCWLCMSKLAKDGAKIGLADWLNRQIVPVIPLTVDTAEEYVAKNFNLRPKVELWKKDELEMKRIRIEEQNPSAFFAG